MSKLLKSVIFLSVLLASNVAWSNSIEETLVKCTPAYKEQIANKRKQAGDLQRQSTLCIARGKQEECARNKKTIRWLRAEIEQLRECGTNGQSPDEVLDLKGKRNTDAFIAAAAETVRTFSILIRIDPSKNPDEYKRAEWHALEACSKLKGQDAYFCSQSVRNLNSVLTYQQRAEESQWGQLEQQRQTPQQRDIQAVQRWKDLQKEEAQRRQQAQQGQEAQRRQQAQQRQEVQRQQRVRQQRLEAQRQQQAQQQRQEAQRRQQAQQRQQEQQINTSSSNSSFDDKSLPSSTNTPPTRASTPLPVRSTNVNSNLAKTRWGGSSDSEAIAAKNCLDIEIVNGMLPGLTKRVFRNKCDFGVYLHWCRTNPRPGDNYICNERSSATNTDNPYYSGWTVVRPGRKSESGNGLRSPDDIAWAACPARKNPNEREGDGYWFVFTAKKDGRHTCSERRGSGTVSNARGIQ